MLCTQTFSIELQVNCTETDKTHTRPTEKIAIRAIFCFFDILRPTSEATGSPSKAKSEMTLKIIGMETCQLAAA